jgi:signal transduction histidine kinase
MKTEPATSPHEPTRDELLRENEQLRGDLFTIARRISHDLRTPLGGILSAGEALKEILQEDCPSAIPLVQSSLDSAHELSRLVKRVSYLAQATSRPLPSRLYSMGAAVSAALERLESKISETGASVSQPESWPELKGVCEWTEEVWWNLLLNALQHAGSAPRIELGWEEENGLLKFWIRDDGQGVAENRRDKLFQPFYQLHTTDSAPGLGLPIIQRLVALQGGECDYAAAHNERARFIFSFAAIAPARRKA